MNDIHEGKEFCKSAAELRQQWQQEENLTKSEALFREAVKKFPDFWVSHFGLGEMLLLKAARERVSAGGPFDEGIRAVRRATEIDPTQPEPLLKLASKLANGDIDAAEKSYNQALKVVESQTESLYPRDWQAIDHWDFAIAAAQRDRHAIAVDAFCHAISMNNDYSGKYMPSPDKANAAWQSALRKLGKTEWFEQREGRDNMLQNILSGKPLDAEPQRKQEKKGCLGMVLVLLCVVMIGWFFLK